MKHRAFTLIELLVVVAIIGILAAVGVVAYNGYTKSAKIAVVKSNHASIPRVCRHDGRAVRSRQPHVVRLHAHLESGSALHA